MYERGDRFKAVDANYLLNNVRSLLDFRESARQQNPVFIKAHQDFPAYSVFGVGSDTTEPFGLTVLIHTKDPNSKSIGPFYTNGSQPMGSDRANGCFPVSNHETRILVEGDIEPGDRARPNDDGKCIKHLAGGLLCVSEKNDNDEAMFIACDPQTTFSGINNDDVSPGASGAVTVSIDGTDTEVENVFLDPPHGNQQISSGKAVWIRYFALEDRWRHSHAECEDTAAATVNTNFNIAQVADLAGRDASLASGQLQMLARVDTNKLTYWTVSGAAGWTPLSKSGSVADFAELQSLSEMEDRQLMFVESTLETFAWLGSWVQV